MKEAVIDLRTQLAPDLDLTKFKSLEAEIGYGTGKEMRHFEFEVFQKEGEAPITQQMDHGHAGYRFASPNGLHVVQMRRDGFTFSRLEPYSNWEETFTEAARLYHLYYELAQPEEVFRLAVRFINRLLLPAAEIGDFSPFLTAPPQFPKDQAVFLTGFLTQVQIQEQGSPICATITQNVQPSAPETDKVPVILDIDVYDPQTFRPVLAELQPRFEALRDAKNRYFFASITEKAAALFV